MDLIVIVNILKVISGVVNFYMFFLFIYAILSLISLFGFIDLYENNIFSKIFMGLKVLIDPPHRFISRYVPNIGNIDLSFMVLILILWIVDDTLTYYIVKLNAQIFAF